MKGTFTNSGRHQFFIVKTRVYWKKTLSIKPWIWSQYACFPPWYPHYPIKHPRAVTIPATSHGFSEFLPPWATWAVASELQVRAAAQCDKGELGDPSSLKLIKWGILRYVCLIILLVFVACNPMNLIPWIFIFLMFPYFQIASDYLCQFAMENHNFFSPVNHQFLWAMASMANC
jgi:hypothetical protein